MKCIHCGRALTKFAVSVDTKAGPYGWGPVCARKVMVGARKRARAQARAARQPVYVDERQMALELETA